MKAMMVLKAMEGMGARVWVENSTFRFRSPFRALGPTLIKDIRSNKADLVQLVIERERGQIPLLPNDLQGALEGWQIGKVLKTVKAIDKTAVDAGGGLNAWTGIHRKTGGDVDLAAELWYQSRANPGRWKALFESNRAAFYAHLIGQKDISPSMRAVGWILSQCHGARQVGQAMALIRPGSSDRLEQWFQSFEIRFLKNETLLRRSIEAVKQPR